MTILAIVVKVALAIGVVWLGINAFFLALAGLVSVWRGRWSGSGVRRSQTRRPTAVGLRYARDAIDFVH